MVKLDAESKYPLVPSDLLCPAYAAVPANRNNRCLKHAESSCQITLPDFLLF